MITKSCGVEWIGDIPQEWEISRIKYVSDFQPTCDTSKLTNESIVTYTPMEYIKNGYYIENDSPYGKLSSSLTQYCEGDIVMAKVTPCFENGNIAIMTNLSSGIGMGSSELFVFRAKRINVKYLFYWLRNTGFVNAACATMTGTGGLKRVSPYFVYNSVICYPKNNEYQQRIVEFLDRKCAEIDSVISKTKATIEQYKSLKQSVITQAVTKGIRTDRPMKDSGIEWIGEIPQEWSKDKVFRSFSIIGSGTTPKSSDDSNYEGNINWIQSGDINGEVLLSVKKHLSYEAVKEYSALRLYSSPFIAIAMYGASIGNLSISEIDSCVNQACCVLAEPKIRIKYAFYSIKAAKDYLITKAVGGGQPNISQDIVKSLWLPIPPVQEQQEISDYLDRKSAEIDSLIAAKEQLLTELESYKKSVIYEYVTGKKEI